jgi:hypothetical protein
VSLMYFRSAAFSSCKRLRLLFSDVYCFNSRRMYA